MRVIGLTGGVGAGKSRIIKLLKKDYGAEVLLADELAHQLMEPGQEAYQDLIKALGTSYLTPDKKIDKTRLSDLIFQDPEALDTVNQIVHPAVWSKIKQVVRASKAELFVVEAALMDQEHGDIFDEVWYVYTSKENRIKRLLDSRGYSREKSLSIMAHQPEDAFFSSLCDRVIDNNKTIQELEAQLSAILCDEGR